MLKWTLKWILICILVSGCSLMSRQNQTNTTLGWNQYLLEQNQAYEQEARRQLGFTRQQVLNHQQQAQLYWRMEVLKEEEKLRYPTEIEQYYRHKPFVFSDRDKVYMLRLRDIYKRQEWLEKNVNVRPERYPAHIENAIAKNDLVFQMNMDAVIRSWGKPQEVLVSGNKVFGNEKWIYTVFEESVNGEVQERRELFFENGILVGWRTY